MARKRMIDPGFWMDEKLGTCSRNERLLFMGLISNADDKGRLPGSAALLKAIIFPYDEDISAKDVRDWLKTLESKKLIQIYTVDGQTYVFVKNFLKHQVIKKPSESKLPPPPVKESVESRQEMPEPDPDNDLTFEQAGKEEKITNQAVIAELVAAYRQVVPEEKHRKGDYGFVGKLYNQYGYDVVLEAIDQIAYSIEHGFMPEEPLLYLRRIVIGPKDSKQKERQEQEINYEIPKDFYWH